MIPGIDRVYVNDRARAELGWQPRHDFRALIARLRTDEDIRSPLAREIGSKGYHDRVLREGPYRWSEGAAAISGERTARMR